MYRASQKSKPVSPDHKEPAEPLRPPLATLPVSQDWLEDVINQKYGTSSKIEDLQCDHIGIGKGFMSNMVRADIAWCSRGEKLPRAIVIKIPTVDKLAAAGKMGEEMMGDIELLERHHNTEVAAYRYFTKLGTARFPMAIFIYGEKHSTDKSGILVVELVEGRSLSYNEDSTVSKVKALLECAAEVQAYGILHGTEDFEAGASAVKTIENMYKAMDPAAAYRGLHEKNPEAFPYSAEDVEAKIIEGGCPAISAVLEGRLPYQPVVVLGDTQPNNVLWKLDETGNLTDTVRALLDFQVTHLGYCMYDVTNFIYWGLPAEDRMEHQDELIELFYDLLKAKVGEEKMPLSLEGMKNEYKKLLRVFFGMFIPFFAQMEDIAPVIGMTETRVAQLRNKASSVLHELMEK